METLLEDLFDTEKFNRKEETSVSTRFLNVGAYSVLDNIPEFLCEWWSSTQKEMHTFLEDEKLSQFISDDAFKDILLGKYYFSDHFLLLLSKKLSNKVTLNRLHALNKKFIQAHPEATELIVNKKQILDFLRKEYKEKKEKKRALKIQKRLENIDEALIKERKYGAAYRERNRDKINQKNKEIYLADLEENRRKNAEKKRAWREKNHEKINENREEINRKRRERYHKRLEENRKKASEYQKEHRDEIKKRQRERYCENLEKNRQKDSEYRQKHRDEINKRKREKYHENLLESRKKFNESHKKYRDVRNANKRQRYHENLEEERKKSREYSQKAKRKKRFQTKTGKTVFSLLDALIQAKHQK